MCDYSRINGLHLMIISGLLLIHSEIALGLEIHVTVPSAVENGKNAILACEYELGYDTLYSLKWYKGRHEFYRYTPKEIPAVKLFLKNGIKVDMESSNLTHVVLEKVKPLSSGRYSCEVSADHPSFQTVFSSGEMAVIQLPLDLPRIDILQSMYRPGEILVANCTTEGSSPAAILEWRVNSVSATSHDTKTYHLSTNLSTGLETSILGISFIVSHEHFAHGKLKMECIARIHTIYQENIVQYIEEDRPHVLTSSSNSNGHAANNFMSDEEYKKDMPSKGFSLWKQVYKPSYGLLTIFLLYLIQVTLSENVS